MEINRRIKALRELNKMALEDVAYRLGVSVSTAQRYESDNGIRTIPYEAIEKYAEMFDVSPSHIMGWDKGTTTLSPEVGALLTYAMKMPPERVKKLLEYYKYFNEKEEALEKARDQKEQ